MRRVYHNPKVYTYRPAKTREPVEVSPKIIWFLLLGILIVGLVYFFLFSSYFKIKNIYIEGADLFEPQISEIVHQKITQRDNVFLFPNNETQLEISQKYPIFKKIAIYKGIPDALKIVLERREAKLIVKFNANDYLVDSDGEAFKMEKNPENLPQIEINRDTKLGDKIFTQDFVGFVKDLWTKFPKETGLSIKKVLIPETDFVVEIYPEANWKAIFDSTKSVDKQLSNLKLLLPEIQGQKIEYIDLRLEEKIYYK